MAATVRPTQLSNLLATMIAARLPLLITGAPGIGKSDIVAQAADAAGARLLISHPAVADPTDAKGLPWPQNHDTPIILPIAGSEYQVWSGGKLKGTFSFESEAKEFIARQPNGVTKATFLPFGELAEALEAKEPLVWFLDDLGQPSPAVQASFMQLILGRRVNGHHLPDTVTFVAATNRRTDRAGVSGILEPVKSRFASIVELEPNLDDWCQWAFAHAVPAMLVAFLRYKPDLLSAFTATADLTNSPVPRTWASVAKLEALKLPAEIEAAAMAGAVGEGAAVEYLAFRKMAAALVNLDAILADPVHAPLPPPTKPDQMYATAVGLAARATDKNFHRVITYLERLHAADHGEFAALAARDATRRDDKLLRTEAYVKMCCGPLGKLITGQH
ncbi:MAG TPA: hypothetical protein VFW94_23520 [Candidatus Acidoferrales bacterium]|nr:hypothetical protein [Candidatus Acidoferrales bacterium]